ncbi:1-aminocyclopropane-1-carboxylate oxidase 5 [Capsicum chinense]|nr:1-aminocyclopropane-1-carboxylate oxidase 5 [Capsicum chinense]
MKEYRSEVKKLAEKVMVVMDENLVLTKGYIKKAFNEGDNNIINGAFFGTKVSHYPPCPHPEKVNSLRAHTDAGGVILLFQDDQVDGLQILKDGQWIDVLPLPNAIVINTGDHHHVTKLKCLAMGNTRMFGTVFCQNQMGIGDPLLPFYNPSLKATISPAPELLVDIIKEKEVKLTSSINHPTFVFGNYMNVYNEQKFLPKEPRFQAVGAL